MGNSFGLLLYITLLPTVVDTEQSAIHSGLTLSKNKETLGEK